jgi:hypothetical protein
MSVLSKLTNCLAVPLAIVPFDVGADADNVLGHRLALANRQIGRRPRSERPVLDRSVQST